MSHVGQALAVVGAAEELGSWQADKAHPLTWHEGHTWSGEVPITITSPTEPLEFKVPLIMDHHPLLTQSPRVRKRRARVHGVAP